MEELTKEQKRTAYRKKYREENKERIAARDKTYKKANKKYIAVQGKAYRKANKEKITSQRKAYRELNKECIFARKKAYREANKEKCGAGNKRYRDKMPCGVYQIQSITEPDKIYIGGSTQIPARWIGHLSVLRRGKHSSSRLQDHYDEFGKNDLVFSILMLVDEADLVFAEQAYIDRLEPCFNMQRAMAEDNMPDRIFDTVLTIVA